MKNLLISVGVTGYVSWPYSGQRCGTISPQTVMWTCWWSLRREASSGCGFFLMQAELSEMFGLKVDLNTPGFLSKYFRDKVIAEAKVLYDAA